MLKRPFALALALCVAAALAVAGCGSSSSGSTSSGGSGAATKTTNTNQQSAKALAEAQAAIAPFSNGNHAAFPVSVPLKTRPKPGFTIAFMDCNSTICGLFHSLMAPAAKLLGVKLLDVKAGSTAQTINAAFETVVQQKPNAIINGGLDPIEWTSALKQLEADKIPIISTGIIDGAKYGLTTFPNTVFSSLSTFTLDGGLEADWIYAHEQNKVDVEFLWIPELDFSAPMRDSFVAEMKRLCPTCVVQTLPISVATLGSTAPQAIVSSLQKNPKINTLAVSNSSIYLGLPAAMKAAGLSNITTVGSGGAPSNFEYVKAGQQTVDLAADFPVEAWGMIDAAVRAAEGQSLSASQHLGIPVQQFLTQKEITFNPEMGWTAYPDFAQRFAKLWGR